MADFVLSNGHCGGGEEDPRVDCPGTTLPTKLSEFGLKFVDASFDIGALVGIAAEARLQIVDFAFDRGGEARADAPAIKGTVHFNAKMGVNALSLDTAGGRAADDDAALIVVVLTLIVAIAGKSECW